MLVAEDLTGGNPPTNRVGHQGLFFERFFVEPGSTVLDPSLTPNAAGLYYKRNRWYSPTLGRFLSIDPNESASPIITALVMNGEALDTLYGAFNPRGHFGDGMNLYEYLGSNPVNRRDALGLDWWDDDIDDAIYGVGGDRIAAAAAAAAQIGMFFNTALAVGQLAFSFVPGADMASLMFALAQGKEVSWADVMWAAVDVGGAAVAGKIVGKLAGMIGRYVKRGAKGLRRSGDSWIRRLAKCNCFVAGTLIETPEGPVPIDCVEVGDEVLTRSEDNPGEEPAPGYVTHVFRRTAPAILWLTLANGVVMGTTPGHEVWTQQDGWTYAGQVEVGDTFVDLAGSPAEIIALALDPTPTVVYNFEVDGTFTYFAEDVWVHNNSCRAFSGSYHKFTYGEFRHNLKVRTGIDPGTTVEAHHVLPHKFRKEFRDYLGIDVNEPTWGAWWDKELHRGNSGAINREWDDFFQRGPTVEGALELAREQGARYGFVVDF